MRIRLSLVFSLSLAATLAFGACGSDVAPQEPTNRVDLRQAFATNDSDPIAVTVTPDGSKRYIFDRSAGLYEIGLDGAATMVLTIGAMPDPGVSVRLPYTDLVALGDNKFALTAIGDGFLLDLDAKTMDLHFCYEPGDFPEEFEQRTDAVAYDRDLDKIIAQPQTFDGTGAVISSDIGFYDRASGADESWYPLNINYVAGGMAVDGQGELFLGSGSSLSRYDRNSNASVEVADLARFGVAQIDGLAFDSSSGNLLVVDGQTDTLVEIGVDEL